MIRKIPALLALLYIIACSAMPLAAQDYISPDQYYRPVTMRELDYRLDPDSSKYARAGAGAGSFRGGCPDEINIGGIGDDVRVIGNVDIEVNIDENFTIDCNRW